MLFRSILRTIWIKDESEAALSALLFLYNIIVRSILTSMCYKCIVCLYKHHTEGAIEKMKVIISNTSDQPLYQQIKEQMKEAIFSGELRDGDPVPSIRNFANDLKVSVLTIRRVYEELENEGFLSRQVGIGTFISTGNLELLRESKRRVVEQKMADMIKDAKALGIPQEELQEMMDILYGEE